MKMYTPLIAAGDSIVQFAEILRELGDFRTVYGVLPTFSRHDDISIELGMGLLGVIEDWRMTIAESEP